MLRKVRHLPGDTRIAASTSDGQVGIGGLTVCWWRNSVEGDTFMPYIPTDTKNACMWSPGQIKKMGKPVILIGTSH